MNEKWQSIISHYNVLECKSTLLITVKDAISITMEQLTIGVCKGCNNVNQPKQPTQCEIELNVTFDCKVELAPVSSYRCICKLCEHTGFVGSVFRYYSTCSLCHIFIYLLFIIYLFIAMKRVPTNWHRPVTHQPITRVFESKLVHGTWHQRLSLSLSLGVLAFLSRSGPQ